MRGFQDHVGPATASRIVLVVILDVRENAHAIGVRHKGNAEDIESIVKDTARDANPGVRQVSRKVFEKYSELWPERVDS